MALFSGWGSLTSRLQPLQRDGLIFKLAEMFIFTTILKGEMKYLHSYSSQHVFRPNLGKFTYHSCGKLLNDFTVNF